MHTIYREIHNVNKKVEKNIGRHKQEPCQLNNKKDVSKDHANMETGMMRETWGGSEKGRCSVCSEKNEQNEINEARIAFFTKK